MKKMISLCLIFLLLLACVLPVSAIDDLESISADDPLILYCGRWATENGSLFGGWQSSCTLRFTGRFVRLKGKGFFLACIDDGEPFEIQIEGFGSLAEGLSVGEHTLLLVPKQYNYTLRIDGFMLEKGAGLLPVPYTPTVEFIGDSLTAGGYETKKDDNYAYRFGYPYQCAKELGWHFYGIAQCGIALCAGDAPMPQKYADWSMNEKDEKKSYQAQRPDYIVVSLGANDQTATTVREGFRYPSEKEFKEAYIAFLQTLTELHPDAVIFVAYAFNGSRKEETARAVKALDSDRIVLVDSLQWDVRSLRVEDNCHYTQKGNAAIAHEVASILTEYASVHGTPVPRPTPTARPAEAEVTAAPASPEPGNRKPNLRQSLLIVLITAGALLILAAAVTVFILTRKKGEKNS